MPAAISSAPIAKQMTSAVPMSGCLSSSAQATPTTISSGLARPPSVLVALRPRGQQLGRVEDQRDLQQLRGLELERAGAEPARRAVHRHADARAASPRRVSTNDATSSSGVSALTTLSPWRDAKCITTSPMQPEHQVALQVEGRVARPPSSDSAELAE